jgi:uncharacterized protein YceK
MRGIEIALIISLIGFSGCATLKTSESGNSNEIIVTEIAKRKQQYSNDKEAIRAEISYTEGLIKKIQGFNQQLQNGKSVNRATAEQGVAKLTREIKILQQLHQYYQHRSNIVELTVWKAKIAQLEQEKYELESHISKLK